MIEAFHDFLKDIYWEDYAEDLLINNPEKYFFELKEFLKNYS